MTAIPERKYILQTEETRFNGAVSESLLTRVGAGNNFLMIRENTQHDFNLNGPYNVIANPQISVDGYITYPFNFEIVSVILFTGAQVGSAGTTEIDIKWKPESSGSYATIFSTTPKVTSSAPVTSSVRNGGPGVSGMVNPVLSKTSFDAYDSIRMDVIQTRTGTVEGLFVKLFVRPRDVV